MGSRRKGSDHLKIIVEDLLQKEIRVPLSELAGSASPYILITFWRMCRVLQNIGPQLGYDKNSSLFVVEFVAVLRTWILDGAGTYP